MTSHQADGCAHASLEGTGSRGGSPWNTMGRRGSGSGGSRRSRAAMHVDPHLGFEETRVTDLGREASAVANARRSPFKG